MYIDINININLLEFPKISYILLTSNIDIPIVYSNTLTNH